MAVSAINAMKNAAALKHQSSSEPADGESGPAMADVELADQKLGKKGDVAAEAGARLQGFGEKPFKIGPNDETGAMLTEDLSSSSSSKKHLQQKGLLGYPKDDNNTDITDSENAELNAAEKSAKKERKIKNKQELEQQKQLQEKELEEKKQKEEEEQEEKRKKQRQQQQQLQKQREEEEEEERKRKQKQREKEQERQKQMEQEEEENRIRKFHMLEQEEPKSALPPHENPSALEPSSSKKKSSKWFNSAVDHQEHQEDEAFGKGLGPPNFVPQQDLDSLHEQKKGSAAAKKQKISVSPKKPKQVKEKRLEAIGSVNFSRKSKATIAILGVLTSLWIIALTLLSVGLLCWILYPIVFHNYWPGMPSTGSVNINVRIPPSPSPSPYTFIILWCIFR